MSDLREGNTSASVESSASSTPSRDVKETPIGEGELGRLLAACEAGSSHPSVKEEWVEPENEEELEELWPGMTAREAVVELENARVPETGDVMPSAEEARSIRTEASLPPLTEKWEEPVFECTRDTVCKLDASLLPDIRAGWDIPEEFELIAAQPGDRASSYKGEGVIGIHLLSLQNGLIFPLPPVIEQICKRFRVPPGQLSPNTYKDLTGFLLLCEKAGVNPCESLWREYFKLGPMSHVEGMFAFSAKANKKFVKLPQSLGAEWPHRFFFVRHPEGKWPFGTRWNPSPKYSSANLPRSDAPSWFIRDKPKLEEARREIGFLLNKDLTEDAMYRVGTGVLPSDDPEMSSFMLRRRSKVAAATPDPRAGAQREQRQEALSARAEEAQRTLSGLVSPVRSTTGGLFQSPSRAGAASSSGGRAETGARAEASAAAGGSGVEDPYKPNETIRGGIVVGGELPPITEEARQTYKEYEDYYFTTYRPDWAMVGGDTIHGDPAVAVHAWKHFPPTRDFRTLRGWSPEILRGRMFMALSMAGECAVVLDEKNVDAAKESVNCLDRLNIKLRQAITDKAKADSALVATKASADLLQTVVDELRDREAAKVREAREQGAAEERRRLQARLPQLVRGFAALPQNAPEFWAVVEEFAGTVHGSEKMESFSDSFFYHGVQNVLKRYPDLDVSDIHPENEDSSPLQEGAVDRCALGLATFAAEAQSVSARPPMVEMVLPGQEAPVELSGSMVEALLDPLVSALLLGTAAEEQRRVEHSELQPAATEALGLTATPASVQTPPTTSAPRVVLALARDPKGKAPATSAPTSAIPAAAPSSVATPAAKPPSPAVAAPASVATPSAKGKEKVEGEGTEKKDSGRKRGKVGEVAELEIAEPGPPMKRKKTMSKKKAPPTPPQDLDGDAEVTE